MHNITPQCIQCQAFLSGKQRLFCSKTCKSLAYSTGFGLPSLSSEDLEKIQNLYNEGLSLKDVGDRLGYSPDVMFRLSKLQYIKSRSKAESASINSKGKLHTKETKLKISAARKRFLAANPHMVPYLLNHKSKGDSYPEKYFSNVLTAAKFTKKFRVGTYELDFADIDNKIDLEIDGEQHFADKRILEHDKKRNKILSELGWRIIRVRWSLFQKLNRDEKEFVVNSINNDEQVDSPCLLFYSADIDQEKLTFFEEKTKKLKLPKVPIPRKTKITWPSPESLQILLWEQSTTTIATNLGVSDNAITKYAKKFNLTKPPRGYWAKIRSDNK